MKRNAQFETGTVTHQTKKTTAQRQKGQNDAASESGGKDRYINKLCNPKEDRYY